jgi:hypothetical protein
MKSDLLNEMKQDADRPVPQDRLEKIRIKVVEMRDLELQTASLNERITKNNQRLKELRDKEIVDLLDQAKLKGFTVAQEGNIPPYEVEVAPYYHANIPEETATAAYEWLKKKGHGDIIKATYTVSFGLGEDKKKKAFEALLKKNKVEYTFKFGVPWNTLTAFVKEQVEEKKAALPLKLLGATVGRVAKVIKQKKDNK